MEVTDKKALAEIEAKQKKLARKEKRWAKRQNGVFGNLVSFKDNIKNKQAEIVIDETKGIYGRAGNRIFIGDKLYMKLKNSTKAKKFMEGLL